MSRSKLMAGAIVMLQRHLRSDQATPALKAIKLPKRPIGGGANAEKPTARPHDRSWQ
jgi:hypothetical protein